MPPDHAEAALDSCSANSRPLSLPARLLRFCNRRIARGQCGVRVVPTVAVALMVVLACERAAADPSSTRSASVVQSDAPFAAFIAEAAQRFAIPALWIDAVMQAESARDVHALSPAGAMGLMQIMPETWAELRVRYGLGADPYQPHDNIVAGAAYLRELHDRYGSPGFLAAYNAGPERWEAHLAHGQELPSETRLYIARLLPVIAGEVVISPFVITSLPASWTEAALFPVQTADRPNAVGMSANPQSATAQVKDWTALAPQSTGLFATASHVKFVR